MGARVWGRAVALGVSVVVCACAREPARPTAPEGDAPPRLLESLAGHHHPITTSSPAAQRLFDQGLVLTFGFNHDAARRAFEEAARLDPACAMCFWGVALALGPNINAPMGPDAGRHAFGAIQHALTLAPATSPSEQGYLNALAARYAPEPTAERTHLDLAYANAMGLVRSRYPEDVDAAVLHAEALMDLNPWDYWLDGAEPREHTPQILELLEWAMERQPTHVGANHYYIHAVEEFYPERAVPAADRLGPLLPDAGHLVHMPSHIYWRVGRYADALESNQRAVASDERFFGWCRPGAFYRAAYYPHNLHFLWAVAAAEGQSELALGTARKLEASVSDQLDVFPFVEEFLAIPALTLARFGRWDAILGLPRPDPARVYQRGAWHYARGLALVRTGALDAARAELGALRDTIAEPLAAKLMLSGDAASAARLLEIGAAHLEGELAAARGETRAALEALERAVALQDAIAYREPPPWSFPTRQALGAVLLEAGLAGAAEAVYRKDLEQHPRNGWSLFGLARSLEAQGNGDAAAYADRGHREAFARADVTLRASRF